MTVTAGGLFGLFTSYFRLWSSKNEQLPQSSLIQPDDPHYRLPKCRFCDVSKEKGFDVVWEDDDFVVFDDRSPASVRHMLVIPKRHVESVKTLKQSDVPLLARMAEIGTRMLDDLSVPPELRKLGFHIPPFNSVNHLHLHTQVLPYKSRLRGAKYPIAHGVKGKEKGFGWFVEVGQAIRILERGGKVGVWPC